MITSDLNRQQDALNNEMNEALKLAQQRDKLREQLSSLERQREVLNVSILQIFEYRKTFQSWRSRSAGSKRNSIFCTRRKTNAVQTSE